MSMATYIADELGEDWHGGQSQQEDQPVAVYDIRPDYTPETISIPAIRQLIWELSNHNAYTVLIAKCRCGYENNGSLYQYEKLLKAVQGLKKEAEVYRAGREINLNQFVNVYV